MCNKLGAAGRMARIGFCLYRTLIHLAGNDISFIPDAMPINNPGLSLSFNYSDQTLRSIDMTTASKTLREIAGLGQQPAHLKQAALIMIDCQNTYRKGVMQLTGVEEALQEARKLLEIARDLKIPVFHIQHDSGEGTPYDIRAEIGAISDEVAPIPGEPVIIKHYPNSFIQTDLDQQLKAIGIKNIVLAGFMTHMCINSTAHGAFNLGYGATVVASATATRPLQGANGKVLTAQEVQEAAIASTRDLYAAIVDKVADIKA
jgi:nicotinamidase-related amidase